MLSARDLTSHEGGVEAAIAAVKRSGLRVTGFQVLRDFEGLSGHLHAYKVDVAKAMLKMCHAVGADLLLVCSSTSVHATGDPEAIANDLAKLAMLAVPLGIRVAYEALSWGRHVNEYPQAWDIVERANRSNLGLALDSFHILATSTTHDELEYVFPDRIFLVQLADFMWQEIRSPEEKINTARHFRVFPGEGVHGDDVAALVRRLDRMGYRGDYSFEVFNDDYVQLPVDIVAARARKAAGWLSRMRSLPIRPRAVAPPPPGV
jgi:sugar phosphate isomerase/epimerase